MTELIGKTVGQYQIIELVLDTSEAQLFKGFQPNMNRYVAVKVLKSQDPAAVQAFTQQNELLAQIQHPNILPIIDSGQVQGLAYRVLRYVEDGLLQDHLFQYRDPRKAAGLISGIVEGLEKIHAQGLVHGNLEPSNIFLDEGGQPLLTDFGLPKAPGAPVTPYMSPEQTQGAIVDRRTEVYALGVLLYEMLTGEAPPPGVVVSPKAKRPDLPESVERVILKAMAQNPDARFQSAREFQNALNAALQPVVPAQAPAPQQPAPQPAQPAAPPPPAPKKTNWAAIILGIVLVIVICGGLGLLLGWWSSQDGEPPVEPTSPPAEVIPTDAPPEPTEPPEPTQEPEPTEPPEATTPPEGGEPPELPEVCNSTGFIGGFFILGSVLMVRKRSRQNEKLMKSGLTDK
jgi:serine/threonine-protein kinase